MIKRIFNFLRRKSGIAENQAALQQQRTHLQRQIDFMASWQQLMTPPVIPLPAELLADIRDQLREEFGAADFSTAISKNDIMFAHHLYANGTDSQRALRGYFRVGCRAVHALQALVAQEGLVATRILDFGSGYGRMSRFLPAFFPQAEITVSEVKDQAMRFQAEHFGFQGVGHAAEAGGFEQGEFDLIVALSVFTHLPQPLFEAWLSHLLQALRPGGSLIFTYKDRDKEAAHLTPETNKKDFLFLPQSEDLLFPFVEDSNLKQSEYGVTFVTRNYLEEQATQNRVQLKFLGGQLAEAQEAALFRRSSE